MFLHGFPEAAFVWDELLEHFARPEHGGYRCMAPNLRGYEKSSQPADVRPTGRKSPGAGHRRADRRSKGRRIECLVAHDWGGAVAWNLANQHPAPDEEAGHHQFAAPRHLPARAQVQPETAGGQRLHEFPHPPGRGALLREDDYRRLWQFFTNWGGARLADRGASSTSTARSGMPA